MENLKYYVFISVLILWIIFWIGLIWFIFYKFLIKKLPFKIKDLMQQYGEPVKVINAKMTIVGVPISSILGTGKIFVYQDFIALCYFRRTLIVRDYKCIKLFAGTIYKTLTIDDGISKIEVYLSRKIFELIGQIIEERGNNV